MRFSKWLKRAHLKDSPVLLNTRNWGFGYNIMEVAAICLVKLDMGWNFVKKTF
jgi:hypothetical protein